jgi:arylamine N-acetyltransferase
MQASEIITAEEALNFVENKLKISNFNSKRAVSALQTVNDIVFALHKALPFQNISLLTSKRNEYGIPTASEIREAGLGCRGGLCATNNIFAWALFSALGFRATTIFGYYTDPGDHVIVLLSDVTEIGSLHLVDVGFGYPTYQAIDLNLTDGEECEFVNVGLR